MEEFKKEEKEILKNFVTNVDSNVFVLKNLPEVVKGALFSRYSRSSKSLKRLLLDEFLLEETIGNTISPNQTFDFVNSKKAEEFYDRVLIGYGDDSVAELAFSHIAIEDVSIVASKFLEDPRIGLSPLEKSTRYVYFDQKVNGEYLFYKEPTIMNSEFRDEYLDLMNHLFDLYSSLIPKMKDYMESKYPKPGDVSDRAYRSTIKAKTCDVLRAILPAATKTNLGLAGNGRAFEYLIIKLRSYGLKELDDLAKKIHQELSKVIPSFVKRSFSEKGDMWVEYLTKTRNLLEQHSIKGEVKEETPKVKLINFRGKEEDVIAALLFEYSNLPYEELHKYVSSLPKEEKEQLVKDLLALRTNRRHKPPRAFELINFTFEVILNLGAYRDLQRHRMLLQLRQPYSTDLGYDVPKEIIEAGFEEEFREAMERAKELYNKIRVKYPKEAMYVVPLAYRVRWFVDLNLREAFHLCELRSSIQGHNDYRAVAIEMHEIIKKLFPTLGDMKFVNKEQIELNRLEAEKRLDKKIEELKKKYSL